MQVIQTINLNMLSKGAPVVLDAVQGDSNTRVIHAALYSGAEPWEPGEGVTAAVSYGKPDGTHGLYSQLPDGTTAVTVIKNQVTAVIAPQVLTVPGNVSAAIVFMHDGTLDRVASFPVVLRVAQDPSMSQPVSNDYYKYSTLDTINKAITGMAPAIPVTMTGTTVSTDMVSPVEHEVECKVSGVDDLTAVTVYRFGRNLYSYKYSVLGRVDIETGIFKPEDPFNRKTSDFIPYNPNLTYYLHGWNWGGNWVCIYDVNKKFIKSLIRKREDDGVFPEKVENGGYMRIVGGPKSQLVIGSKKLEFEEGIEPATFTPSPDGTVSGMKSISPSMTILTDNPGATVTATYNADTKRYIDNKFAELQALTLENGGV